MFQVPAVPVIPGARPVSERKKKSPTKPAAKPASQSPDKSSSKPPRKKAEPKAAAVKKEKSKTARPGAKSAKHGVESVRGLSLPLPPPEERGAPGSLGASDLDPDQARALALRHSPALLLSAGPGAGKTFTLNRIVCQLREDDPGSRILVLMFNVAAEQQFLARLEAQGCPALPRQGYNPYAPPAGVLCCTFDKFAAAVLRANRMERTGGSYAESKALALRVLVESPLPPGSIDYLVIDEAQDVAKDYVSFCQHLLPRSKHFVLAGDPRQELYEGAGWFSTMWSSSPRDQRVVLRYNHRSDGAIVDLLNEFSALHFPTLHHDQIPTRPKTRGAVTFHEHSQDQDLIDMLEAGMRSARFHEVYAIAPITVQKFNLGPVSEAVVNRLGKRGLQANLLDNNFEARSGAEYYALGTATKLKGTERRRVLTYGHHPPYSRFGIEDKLLIKATFVALSRAQEQLHIFLPSTALPPGSPLAVLRDGVKGPSSTEPPQLSLPPLAVTEHLSTSGLILAEEEDRLPIPALRLPEPAEGKANLHYPAFNGVLVETAIALQLGCSTAYWEQAYRWGKNLHYYDIAKTAGTAGRLGAGLFRLDSASAGIRFSDGAGSCSKIIDVLVTRDKAPGYIDAYLAEEVERESPENSEGANNSASRFNKIYALSVIKYTAQVGEWWRCTEEWKESVAEVIMEYAREISALFDTLPSWNERVGGRIGALGIGGEADFILEMAAGDSESGSVSESLSAVVEVKFAVHSVEHLRQAGIYASFVQADRTFVLNAREGCLIRLARAPPLRQVVQASLALETLRIGYGLNGIRRLDKGEFWGQRLVVGGEGGAVSLFCGSGSPEAIFPGKEVGDAPDFAAWAQSLGPHRHISWEEAASCHSEWCRLNGWDKEKSPLLSASSSYLDPECEISLGRHSCVLRETCSPEFLRALQALLFLAAGVNWSGTL